MNEYQEKLEQFNEDLLNLSNQTIIDLKGILLNKIITYQLNRNDSDIVAYLFEYDYELLGLTFYGLDKRFDQYTEHISLPTLFHNENWKSITQESIYRFECEKTMNSDSEEDAILFDEYLGEKYEIFENWFFTCWKEATKGIEFKKDAYFSIHDTGDRIDLLLMEEINEEEILKRYE